MPNVAAPSILIGSTFPLSLIRRPVLISPQDIETLKTLLRGRKVYSFWGHQNTLAAARQMLDADVGPINPSIKRPALALNDQKLPVMNGLEFSECWVLSPEYIAGFRPQIGEEVALGKITGWQVLKIEWLNEEGFHE